MKHLLNYENYLFEIRFQDNLIIKGTGLTFNSEFDNETDFLKFLTINKYENGKKIRYNITWNDKKTHDFTQRIQDRTSIKSMSELKIFVSNFLKELFENNDKEITKNGIYSLWLSEYDISFITNINKNNKSLYFSTVLSKYSDYNVINVIELKTKI